MSDQQSLREKKDKNFNWKLTVFFLILVVIGGYIYLYVNSSNLLSGTPTNSLSFNNSSNAPSGLRVDEVLNQIYGAGRSTSIQAKETAKSFNGQRIKWYFIIRYFNNDGSLTGDVFSSLTEKDNIPIQYTIGDPLPFPWLIGIPTNTAVNMHPGDIVEVEATLYFRDTNYNDGTYRIQLENPIVYSINPTPVPSPTPDCSGATTTINLNEEISIGKQRTKKVKSIIGAELDKDYGFGKETLGNYTILKYKLSAGRSYRFTWNAFGKSGIGIVQNEFGGIFAQNDPEKNSGFEQMRIFTTDCAGNYYVFVSDTLDGAKVRLIDVTGL
jgi:hypothetical protein